MPGDPLKRFLGDLRPLPEASNECSFGPIDQGTWAQYWGYIRIPRWRLGGFRLALSSTGHRCSRCLPGWTILLVGARWWWFCARHRAGFAHGRGGVRHWLPAGRTHQRISLFLMAMPSLDWPFREPLPIRHHGSMLFFLVLPLSTVYATSLPCSLS